MIVGLVLLVISQTTLSAEGKITSLGAGSGYFSNQESSLSFSLQGVQQWAGSVYWTLLIKNRSISKGDKTITLNSSNRHEFDISLAVPPVKNNLMLEALLKIELVDQNTGAAITFSKPLLIFGRDPFGHQQGWMREVNIQLYDPTGKTSEILSDSKIPFKKIRSLDMGMLDRNGLLVIGASTPLSKRQGESLLRFADAGISVVCLAPSQGNFPINFHHASGDKPVFLHFNDSSIIKALNHNLDSSGWSKDREVVSSSLYLSGNKFGSVAKVQQDNGGWPWLEIEFPKNKAKLIFVGFSIIQNWNTSPTPRYLFESILHYAKDDKQLL